jgi:hypothetical protein
VDFQFSQFLQAENVPASLVPVKNRFKDYAEDGFAFFCIRIFAQMCGMKGNLSLNGSLFMTEPQWQRFKPGLNALEQLRKIDPGPAYTNFLLLRASDALSTFASPDHHALARLMCLASVFDREVGSEVSKAFGELNPSERNQLVQWLTADGVQDKPGYILCEASALIDNAKANNAVGTVAALRMLIRVQAEIAKVLASQPSVPSKVMLRLDELGQWAKDAGPDVTEFSQAAVSLNYEGKGDTQMFIVQVNKPGADSGSVGHPVTGILFAHCTSTSGVAVSTKNYFEAWKNCVSERKATEGAQQPLHSQGRLPMATAPGTERQFLFKPEAVSQAPRPVIQPGIVPLVAREANVVRAPYASSLATAGQPQTAVVQPRIQAQLGVAFKPPSRTRHLAQVLKAQRKNAPGGPDLSTGVVTRL